jgi:hypothetical protein
MLLARERAMAKAYLLSGDEDIREGAAAAQQMGVSIVLLGVPARGGQSNQADSLVREADEHLVLSRTEIIDPHVRAAATVASATMPHQNTVNAARPLGLAFGSRWLAKATHVEAANLRRQSPAVPRELDAQLFQEAERSLGPLRGRQDVRRELRAGFWDAVMQATAVGADLAVATRPSQIEDAQPSGIITS